MKNPTHIYHVEFDPPKREGVCDQDGSRLIQRDDDKEETIRTRLEVYHAQTKPLIGYYEERDCCAASTGAGPRTRCTPYPRDAGNAAVRGRALTERCAV